MASVTSYKNVRKKNENERKNATYFDELSEEASNDGNVNCNTSTSTHDSLELNNSPIEDSSNLGDNLESDLKDGPDLNLGINLGS
jgi:hypothetical protein